MHACTGYTVKPLISIKDTPKEDKPPNKLQALGVSHSAQNILQNRTTKDKMLGILSTIQRCISVATHLSIAAAAISVFIFVLFQMAGGGHVRDVANVRNGKLAGLGIRSEHFLNCVEDFF